MMKFTLTRTVVGAAVLAGLCLLPLLWLSLHPEARGIAAAPGLVEVTPDGLRAYAAAPDSGTIHVVSLSRGAVTGRFAVEGEPRGIGFSRDGSRAYITFVRGDAEGAVAVVDTALDKVIRELAVPRCTAGHVSVGPDGATLSLAAPSGKDVCTAFVDIASGRVSGVTRREGAERWLVGKYDATGATFHLSSCDGCGHHLGGMTRWRVLALPSDPQQRGAVIESSPETWTAVPFDVSADGNTYALAGGAGPGQVQAVLVDRKTGGEVGRIPFAAGLHGELLFGRSGKTLYALHSLHPQRLSVLDTVERTGRAALALPTGRHYFLLRETPDATRLLAASDYRPDRPGLIGEIAVIDLATSRVTLIPLATSGFQPARDAVWDAAMWLRARNPWVRSSDS